MGNAAPGGETRRVEQQPVAEILPGLYRAVLDAVADLEARGYRREAAQIRTDATHAYSHAWNQAAANRLRVLRAKAGRIVEGGRRRPLRPAVIETLKPAHGPRPNDRLTHPG